jgi:hypothetical protein
MPSASHRWTAHPSSSDQGLRLEGARTDLKDRSKGYGHLAPTAPGTRLSNCSLVAYSFGSMKSCQNRAQARVVVMATRAFYYADGPFISELQLTGTVARLA